MVQRRGERIEPLAIEGEAVDAGVSALHDPADDAARIGRMGADPVDIAVVAGERVDWFAAAGGGGYERDRIDRVVTVLIGARGDGGAGRRLDEDEVGRRDRKGGDAAGQPAGSRHERHRGRGDRGIDLRGRGGDDREGLASA